MNDILTADALRELRARLGITQKQMAEKLLITTRHYQRLEAGLSSITKRLARDVENVKIALE